jgi:hypothetical protein
MHGLIPATRVAGQRSTSSRRQRHQIRKGSRRAAVQALAGARLWLGAPIPLPTQAEAAVMTGSTRTYVQAAAVVIEHGDVTLIARVEAGHESLLQAAERVKNRVKLVRAFRTASPADLKDVGRSIGPELIFDRVVSPALV